MLPILTSSSTCHSHDTTTPHNFEEISHVIKDTANNVINDKLESTTATRLGAQASRR
jgi:hypothetical protein